ncbi:LON peptidase substrate-binding domain-containing protein [Kaustia mangrovi]|uniref:LON peptidase substrate-binding domain-containing protein n=1 Tax=Kaustia mangrovi TaxID=2593653 RepID=A0A7S8HCC9_9HYPH|nr:LON peptidase substrate-binding domain-containing protein [Kaustia mangrovi]QPC43334.1 LON peptidase substrate-binding domain-containing protein [Kaustia mangrovi]
MGLVDRYRTVADLDARIPIFPLGGALLLPRGQLPLNIFEPRYLAMVDHALAGSRIVGMVQPDGEEALALQDDPSAKPDVYAVGCAGRITAYVETPDNRRQITLTGICRFEIAAEPSCDWPFRMAEVDYGRFAGDLTPGAGQEAVDRERVLAIFRSYLDANGLKADWSEIERTTTESLVNTLCMISPYAPSEKQALLEAEDLKTRAEILVTLTEMALAGGGGSPPPLQ